MAEWFVPLRREPSSDPEQGAVWAVPPEALLRSFPCPCGGMIVKGEAYHRWDCRYWSDHPDQTPF